jgi:peptidoglycan/LPS O-acetylase OafA/YrhL
LGFQEAKTSSMERRRLKRIPVVDLFRGISILITLAHHLGPLYITLPYQCYLVDFAWYKLWCAGGYGVSMFFAISGYLITRLIAANPSGLFLPDFRDFYTRRAGRILPLLFVVCVFGFVMLKSFPSTPSPNEEYCFRHTGAHFSWVIWASIATFSFNWYKAFLGAAQSNFGLHWDVMWSLSVEEQFYLFYPLILKNLRTMKNLILFLTLMVVLMPLTNWINYHFNTHHNLWNSFAHFGMMAIGALLFLAEKQWKTHLEKNPRDCWLLCGAGLCTLCFFGFHSSAKIYVWTSIWGETFIGLGLFLFLLGGLHLNIFHSKFWIPLTLPGELSYGMYLFHASVLFFIWPWMLKTRHFEAFLIFCAATALAAYLSYRFFEKPLNLWIRTRINPKGASLREA